MDPALKKPERRCLVCGTILGWNHSTVCCLCESNAQETVDHRVKVPVSAYDAIVELRGQGWTWGEIAEVTGVSANHLNTLISKYQREQEHGETD
jgi:hypothetical protein